MRRALACLGVLVAVAVATRAHAQPAPAGPQTVAPAPRLVRLRNGLRVWIVARPSRPRLAVGLAVGAGAMDDPADTPGLSTVLASALSLGSSGRDGRPLAVRATEAGLSLDTEAALETTLTTCGGLPRDLDACLELVGDANVRPAFPESRLSSARADALAGIQDRRNVPLRLALAHARNLLFGDEHPAGRAARARDLEHVERPALLELWRGRYRPGNAVLVVVGDVSAERVRASAERHLGAWQAAPVAERARPAVPERKGTRVLLVDRDDVPEASIVLAQRGPGADEPTHAALRLIADVLAGPGPDARLAALGAAGLLTRAEVLQRPHRHAPSFELALTSPTGRAVDAVLGVAAAMRTLQAEALDSAAVDSARGALLAREATDLQRASALVETYALGALAGGAAAEPWKLPAQLAAFGGAELAQIARTTLAPDALVVVIVGRADAIAATLTERKIRFERITASDPVSFLERARRREVLAQATSSGEAARARAVLEQAVAAQGGARLRGVRELSIVKIGTRRAGDELVDIKSVVHYRRPGTTRVEQELVAPGGATKLAFVVTPQAVRGGPPEGPLGPVPSYNERRLRASVFEDVQFVALNLLEARPAPPMTPLPAVEIGGRRAEGVLVRMPSGEWSELYFDAETHLLALVRASGGEGDETEELVEDWRDVNGVRFSFRQRSRFMGAATGTGSSTSGEAKVTDVKLEPKLSDALFR